MRITRISAWQVDLPLHEGSYKWSGGKSVTVFDSTVVAVETDTGLAGYGEVCPLGPAYLAAYAGGVRAGLAELGPHLIGEDPLELAKINRRMDAVQGRTRAGGRGTERWRSFTLQSGPRMALSSCATCST